MTAQAQAQIEAERQGALVACGPKLAPLPSTSPPVSSVSLSPTTEGRRDRRQVPRRAGSLCLNGKQSVTAEQGK